MHLHKAPFIKLHVYQVPSLPKPQDLFQQVGRQGQVVSERDGLALPNRRNLQSSIGCIQAKGKSREKQWIESMKPKR
jgi:hypothetical protein